MPSTTTDSSSTLTESGYAMRNPFAAFMDPQSLIAVHDRMAAQVQQSVIYRPLDKVLPIQNSEDDDVAALDNQVATEMAGLTIPR